MWHGARCSGNTVLQKTAVASVKMLAAKDRGKIKTVAVRKGCLLVMATNGAVSEKRFYDLRKCRTTSSMLPQWRRICSSTPLTPSRS